MDEYRMTVQPVGVRSRLMRGVGLAAAVIVVGLGLAACGGSGEPDSPVTPTVSDSPTHSSSVDVLPTGWDAPEPASAAIVAGSATDGVLVATFEGNGDLRTWADAYAKQLQAAGWKPDENNIVNQNSIWFKGDRRLDLSGKQMTAGSYQLLITTEPKT